MKIRPAPKIFIILVAAAILWQGAVSAAENVSIKASVDRKSILIGERIRYTIEIKYKSDIEAPFPVFKDNTIGDFEIKESGDQTKKGFFGSKVSKKWYLITAYTPGKHTIPEAEVKYRQKGKKDWLVLKTAPINIFIDSLLAKEKKLTDIRDVKGPLHYFDIVPFIVFAAIAIICVTAYILYRRRKSPAVVKLPHEFALEELVAIRNAYIKNSDIKEYYVGVSDCIRRYIERSFALRAPEMTTEEFLDSLKDSGRLSAEEKALLREFLNACDLVKFAKYQPGKQEIESVFTSAKKFVEETKEAKGSNDVRI